MFVILFYVLCVELSELTFPDYFFVALGALVFGGVSKLYRTQNHKIYRNIITILYHIVKYSPLSYYHDVYCPRSRTGVAKQWTTIYNMTHYFYHVFIVQVTRARSPTRECVRIIIFIIYFICIIRWGRLYIVLLF